MKTTASTRPLTFSSLTSLFLGVRQGVESLIPDDQRHDVETVRRYHLIASFHRLGLVVGLLYTVFYYAVGFTLGGSVLAITVLGMGFSWPLLLRKRSPKLVGNYFSLVITTSLALMTPLQGGIRSPAISWLAVPPLVCLLISGGASAAVWAGICIVLATGFWGLDHMGVTFIPYYPPALHGWILLSGYVGLIFFVLAVALIIEQARVKAFRQLQATVDTLSAANQHLARLQHEKDELFDIVAHDLASPLTTITGAASLLDDGDVEDESEVKLFYHNILSAARRMRLSIEQILNLKALEQNRLRLESETISLREFIEEHLPFYALTARDKQIEILFSSPRPDTEIQADRRALLHIADNLISNALKYSPYNTRMFLRVRTDDQQVVLEVEDEGPGIPEDQRDHLFERFTLLGNKPTGRESSHGLGLYIVKKFVEASHGTVTCAPFTGHGACFTVRLPRAQSVAANSGSEVLTASGPTTS